jgi:hypothetical protein
MTDQQRGILIEAASAGATRLGTTLSMVEHYAQAVARWTLAGWPMRSGESVRRLLAICESQTDCYADGHCLKCGCKVNNWRFPLANKLKMAGEKCPLGKW